MGHPRLELPKIFVDTGARRRKRRFRPCPMRRVVSASRDGARGVSLRGNEPSPLLTLGSRETTHLTAASSSPASPNGDDSLLPSSIPSH
jgi:hypothetical protein